MASMPASAIEGWDGLNHRRRLLIGLNKKMDGDQPQAAFSSGLERAIRLEGEVDFASHWFRTRFCDPFARDIKQMVEGSPMLSTAD